MDIQWGPKTPSPTPSFGDIWYVESKDGTRDLGHFLTREMAEEYSRDFPGSRVLQRKGILSLGGGYLKDGGIGF